MTREPGVHRVRIATDVTLSYVVQGEPSGPAVLLLHPWVESRRCFDRLTARLPSSLRVWAVDQRGHGDAEKPANGYELTSTAGDVVAFMDSIGLSSAVLVGSSSGGYVAQQVSIEEPDRVAGLVLIGAPRSLRDRPAFADEVERLTDPLDPEWVRQSMTWFPRFHEVPDWYVEARVEDALRVPARVWRAALTGLLTAEPPIDAGTIDCPTLILWGDRDGLLSRTGQQDLADAIPGSELVVYLDTGHLVLWEQPARVARDVSRFIEALGS